MTPAEILQQCLEAVASGRQTIAEVVARYPEVEGLAEQLQTARSLQAMPLQKPRGRGPRAWPARWQRQAARLRSPVRRLIGPRPLRFWALLVAVLVSLALAGAVWYQSVPPRLPGGARYGRTHAAVTYPGRLDPLARPPVSPRYRLAQLTARSSKLETWPISNLSLTRFTVQA